MKEPLVCAVMTRCADCGRRIGKGSHVCARAPLPTEKAKCGKCGREGGPEAFPVKRGRLRSPCRSCRRPEQSRHYPSQPARTARWRDKFPEKLSAQQKLRYAVKTGRLERKPCEECGNSKSEGHHPDYSKPLEVKWLCRKCHAKEHRIYVAA